MNPFAKPFENEIPVKQCPNGHKLKFNSYDGTFYPCNNCINDN